MPLSDLSPEEFTRIYGPWGPRNPADAVYLLSQYTGRWWIAGGWAIEAFTGTSREHGDLDVSIPRRDLPQLRSYLAGRIDLWAADQETLRLLLPGDAHLDTIPDSCENVWARRGGADPWEYDVTLMDLTHENWVFKRDRRVARPVDQIVWTSDGVDYLRPEIQLLHKARGLRPKDQADFEATRPLLGRADRDWLRAALELVHPGHRWIDQL